jgi:hypothetical protein
LDSQPEPFVTNDEFDEAYWVSLEYLWDRNNWISFEYTPENRQYSGIILADHYIWGFTLRVLVMLSVALNKPLTEYLREDERAYFRGEAF